MDSLIMEWLTFDHALNSGVAILVVESLRRFGKRLDSLEQADEKISSEVHRMEVAMAARFVTREEISSSNREIRVDMRAHHEMQMKLMGELRGALDSRVDRMERHTERS
jgi:hypothetical protein